ncbi:hypothetical protein HNP46_006067 [Pseudomonas nitritireducens]|uniref:HAD family hydrolase n=1 Tax=Pseudomonas nitroreducens TaxID=46680 RepID=A0A7W7P3Y3_PSENT|nr:HAD domain-containing protein [Pseudomonas nitritireducens]MBB4867156.1 hypothetical protein [Pseudomonas nitritireducens]
MLLFLDFDGVVHKRRDGPEFCYVPRLAAVLRDFPAVEVVISSSWRDTLTLDEMRAKFPEDLRLRIIGATPRLNGSRSTEIKTWVKSNRPGAAWLALDDELRRFTDKRRLVLCDDGFLEAEEAELRRRLARR